MKRKEKLLLYSIMFFFIKCVCVFVMVGEWHRLRKGKRGRSVCGRVDELLVVITHPSHQHRGPQKKKIAGGQREILTMIVKNNCVSHPHRFVLNGAVSFNFPKQSNQSKNTVSISVCVSFHATHAKKWPSDSSLLFVLAIYTTSLLLSCLCDFFLFEPHSTIKHFFNIILYLQSNLTYVLTTHKYLCFCS